MKKNKIRLQEYFKFNYKKIDELLPAIYSRSYLALSKILRLFPQQIKSSPK